MSKYEIEIERAPARAQPLTWETVPFGRVFSRHMAIAYYKEGSWKTPRIQPLHELSLHPGTSALHYGQALFEGMKAYQRADGMRFAFRVKDHWQRLNLSATRLAMPEVPYELFAEMLHALLRLESDIFPPDLQHALYIRPLYFAADPWLGVRPSDTYIFLIYLTPVGPYYVGEVNAYVETEMSRAAPGGTGAVKMAGNYAAAMLSGKKAQAAGCQVSLWLDSTTREYIEEFSTMNAFLVLRGPRLITPPLDRGTILPGITRDTLLRLAQLLKIPTEERDISLHEITEGLVHGEVLELFGSGTAATIMPIRAIHYRGKVWTLPIETPIAQKLKISYFELLSGQLPAPNSEWIWQI
ncbi:MAG: branched-chain amino acid aminotransferase [Bacteroidia bacterium]|nr:branched-chain amino acid aminotransferase [Bacteroidia bacterium]MDW8417152.1 branched-chain amino acid aminotransferase [Bacteroidia bacterium]